MRCSIWTLMLLALSCGVVLGDEIILKDGTHLYGEVQRDGDDVVVVDWAGNAVVLKGEVNEVKDVARLREEYAGILARSGEKPPHAQLGSWCWKRGLFEEASAHFQAVLEADPDNALARWGLGHLRVRDTWVEPGVWTALPGEEKAWVRWTPQGAKGKLQVRKGEKPGEARDLVRTASYAAPEERARAAEALAALPEGERREVYTLALLDRSSRVRRFAAKALASSAGLEVAKTLMRAALYDPIAEVRRTALDALAEGSFPMAADLLVEGLNSKHLSVRLNAADALGRFKTRQAAEALCMFMESSEARYGGSPRVNIFVGRQFGYVRDFDVEVAQFTAIGDPIVATQMEGVVLDVRVLHAVEKEVSLSWARAHRSLARIAGRDLGRDVTVWRTWIEEELGS